MDCRPEPQTPTAYLVTVFAANDDEAQVIAGIMWWAGVRGIEERAGELLGHTADAADAERVATALLPRSATVEPVSSDQLERWREHVEPIRIADDLLIVPDWIAIERSDDDCGEIRVRLDPETSFGLGNHPTTAEIASRLGPAVAELNGADDLLDIGSGSGILSIVGALRGVASVDAVEPDGSARRTTVRNFERNGLSARLRRVVSDVEQLPPGACYDVIVANVPASVHRSVAPIVVRRLRPGGCLLISGFLSSQRAIVDAAYERLELIDRAEMPSPLGDGDPWQLVELRRS